ncbi:glycoside hydrolase family 55 protein [Paenibacillus allorhizosphaerae]|uniref:Rhamnogalacturonase A/B/Epimerase-like pectate lyase domain-containing protein n=1 Tax=Paenibacillus allorhizosphaerae TaxID=2849866 RepID=A0ABM8VLH6_9BACL|nr:glycoside hydrolase family 55 protein [Paenibacillus allorhizosphaerae]CAG7648595.1 hypothetical protein PAECIP111802_04259 [Paenibacillus allorhizosphaerae]
MYKMKKMVPLALLFAVIFTSCSAKTAEENGWRSALYPKDWKPGVKDAEGRFLHDFSYAGYRMGETPIPSNPPGKTYNAVTFGADPTGQNDSTAAIQKAIDQAGAAGGGVVLLPAGTYGVRPDKGRECALCIRHSGVVLRGEGAQSTFIRNDETSMRNKRVISVFPAAGGDWHKPAGKKILLTQDVMEPTRTIPVSSVDGLKKGEYVVIQSEATGAFIAEHGMSGKWNDSLKGPTFYRQIVAVDAKAGTITVDIPTRYPLKLRDHASVYKVAPSIEEVGIERLSIGMRQNPKDGWGDLDFDKAGTGAYEVHGSKMVQFRHALNSWMNEVESYRPKENKDDIHTLSDAVELYKSRSITIRNSTVQNPQYKGEGGNGYGFIMAGSDNLVIGSKAVHSRHGFDFKSMWTSGNVLYRSSSQDPRLASDFHMHLSMANLFDNMTADGDLFEAKYRPYGTTLHGQTTTQSVFWNTNGVKYMKGKSFIVESKQFGHGYVIGTKGPASGVLTKVPAGDNSLPEDFVEGVGQGDTLLPQSLYADQLAKRGFKLKE